EQRALDVAVVHRDLCRETVAEHGRIEADLDLARALRSEVRVADVEWEERRGAAPADRIPGSHGVERARRTSGLAPREPKLHLRNRLRPERFIGSDPAEARLRVHLQAKVLAERAVSVDARAERQEIPIL